MNSFLKEAMTKNATTWNNAVSHSTTDSAVLDYFYKSGSFRGRDASEVNSSMASIFAENPELALKIVFYNRMITRKLSGFVKSDGVQKGQGQRDEFIKSIAWLENNYPDLLYKNLWAVPTVGRWSDLWYDSANTGYYHYVDSEHVYKLIKNALTSEYQCNLLAKYLPKIRSVNHCTSERHRRINQFARGLCRYLGWTEKQYRKFKSNPKHTAHIWQRQMCANDWENIDFNLICGKALFNLISQKGKDHLTSIERHKIEKRYLAWIKLQPVAKFTGYVYELYKAAKGARNLAQTWTYNKQFDKLLETATKDVPEDILNKGVLCALDTSGSMSSLYELNGFQGKLAPIDVCVGLGIFFSKMLKGYFANHVIMFDNNSEFLKLDGDFCNRVDQISRHATAWGGTDFQSVVNEIIRVRMQNKDIPISEFPQIILVVSDMQFNPAEDNTNTNYKVMCNKFDKAFGENKYRPTMIWWQVNGRFTKDVPNKMTDPGIVLISGFDPSIVTVLLGGQEEVIDEVTGEKRKLNPYESMLKALDQEVLNRLKTK